MTAGENEGKVLEHTSVVRKLKALGQLDSFESLDSITTSLTYEADWNSENFNLVTIVQSQTDGEIVGVTERQL